jgi:tetratricopeptide (TPR) repeat protein
LLLAVLPALLLAGCGGEPPADTADAAVGTPPAASGDPDYVGSDACADCHREEFDRWRGSQHQRAMQVASAQTVAGDFGGTRFQAPGVEATFTREGDRYLVRTEGASGTLETFPVAYTFGVFPLQQYLVPFPGGRLQALPVAWDTRPAAEGGQRWLDLQAEERADAPIRPSDPLHWTGRNLTWNHMCADCHSTAVRKRFTLATRSYATTWTEVHVGCEACHGPGAAHISWAQAGGRGGPAFGFVGLRGTFASAAEELATCGRCHARRSVVQEGFTAGDFLLNHYVPALLEAGLYYADGQIRDEVYVYGSFVQSRMHRRGVLCSDCHDPHAATPKAPGNATCTQCHRPDPPARFHMLKAKDYDAPSHHFHPVEGPGSAGAACVACHMPSRVYMRVDERRDHSFRIPRPDLTAKIGTPNACNACHSDRTPEWAAEEIRKRYPHEPRPHPGEAIAAGRRRQAAAEAPLAELAMDESRPGILRATALSLLAGYGGAASHDAILLGLGDDDALVRIGALRAAARMSPDDAWASAHFLLRDARLAVRLEAAALLAPASLRPLAPSDRATLDAAFTEYAAAQRLNADRPQAHTSLGTLWARAGRPDAAEAAYRTALALDPAWVPALVNLADLYRAQHRDGEAGALLESAIRAQPGSADAHLAYGLWLTRQGRAEDSLAELARAAELDPDEPRTAYVYGVALNSHGQGDAALRVLESADQRFGARAEILLALATIHRDRGEIAEALACTDRLLALRPDDPTFVELRRQLEAME